MNISSLKNSFFTYLEEQGKLYKADEFNETEQNIFETDYSDISLYKYADEFKLFLQSKYDTAGTNLMGKSMSDLLKMEVPIANYESYGANSKGIFGLSEKEHPIITVATYEMYRTMIDSALAVGLSTEILLRNQPWRYSEDVLYLQNDIDLPDVRNTTYLIVHKDTEKDRNIQQIIQMIKDIVDEIKQQ